MKTLKNTLPEAAAIFLIFTVICGIVYTGVVTGIARLVFPDKAIPVDLVTCSGSGLDPHISPAAAKYQTARIAKANHMTEDEVEKIIDECTDGRFLGIFGEETVNVLKVNLMLDGIL